MARPRPTIRRRRVAREVRRLREERGRTREDIARLLDCGLPKISKLETHRANFNPSELIRVLDYLDAAEPLRLQLIEWNREARHRGLLQEHPEAAPEIRRPYMAFEQDASALQVYEVELVHGLAQTEDYARAVVEAMAPGMADAELRRRVELRMARQSLLSGDDPIDYWLILNEAVIRRAVGGPKVMFDQVVHLLALAKMRNVTLQILPNSAGAHAAMSSPFTILSFGNDEEPPMVYVEDVSHSYLLEKAEQLDTYNVAFNRLRASALSPRLTSVLLREVANEWTRAGGTE
jgi:transcriptional regulator with XRE-family HTH domain